MRTIETVGTVTPDGTLTIDVPPDVEPGEHQVVVMIDMKPGSDEEEAALGFPVIDVDAWPTDLSLRREEMYGDWGR